MPTTLLAFHGYTLNGTAMSKQLAELAGALASHVDIVCPDAPHTCDPASVDRLYASWGAPRSSAPHLGWWDATEDGAVYRGWEETRDAAREWTSRFSSVGVLGFSQGAMLVAALAALSGSEQFPPIRFAIMIGGRKPRAEALQSLFERTIRVPSLHVWGDADRLTGSDAPALVEHFDPTTREVFRWAGPHAIPTRGPAAAAIVDFVRRHA